MDRDIRTGRRGLLRGLGAAALGGSSLGRPTQGWTQARADALRILCGYPPGGALDTIARGLADRLGVGSPRPALVENKPGAAGRVVIDELKRAPADGSVMAVTPASVLTLYPHVYRQLAYDPFTDVAPVAPVALSGFAFAVGPKVPQSVDGFEAFVRWARTTGQPVQCGNAGAGSLPHLMALLLVREAGLDLVHVPYRGGSAAAQDTAAGQVSCTMATESAVLGHVQSGRLRVLATTWPDRSPVFDAAPSFRTLGLPALVRQEWFGVVMPGRTPAPVVASTAASLREIVGLPEIAALWKRSALATDWRTPAQLRAAIREEHDFWGPVVRDSGFTPEA